MNQKISDIENNFVASPHCLLSLFDRGRALAVTPDGLRCQSREQKEWHGCRATKGVQGPGKFYFEAIVTDEGLCRVGWSTSQVKNCKITNTMFKETKNLQII